MARRGEDGAGVSAVPAAVGALHAYQVVERRLAVLRPGDLVGVLGAGEETIPAVVAENVDGLGIVVVGVLIVAGPAGAQGAEVLLAELEPLLDQRRVVVAEAEAA